jgi:hypothetical protein
MLFNNSLAQIQTEAQASRRLIAVRLDETLENILPAFDGYTYAMVAHRQHHVAGLAHSQSDLNTRLRGAEFEGVVEQIREHLLDAQHIHSGSDGVWRVDTHQALRCSGTRQVVGRHDELADVRLLAGQRELPRRDNRGVHQPADQG